LHKSPAVAEKFISGGRGVEREESIAAPVSFDRNRAKVANNNPAVARPELRSSKGAK